MKARLGLGNLFVLIFSLPFGIIISACIYYLIAARVEFPALLELPVKITLLYYWVPLVALPPALACWRIETIFLDVFNTKSGAPCAFRAETQSAEASQTAAGTFNVRRNNTAARCDICHQDDLFIAKTGFCRRCQRYTF